MRMSCNGCRVLRKGCSESCNIRPCLDWIESPESQANATLFLAKFYGRAGLVNLINAGPQHLRPSIFKSLLYEACGRIIHPIHGSNGLIRSNKWHLCQAAVDSVLAGSPISANTTLSSTEEPLTPPFQAGDIRHLSKPKAAKPAAEDSPKPRTTRKSRRSKRSSASGEPTLKGKCEDESIGLSGGGSVNRGEGVKKRSRRTSSENDALSGETVEAELLVGKEKKNGRDDGEVGLDLSLGFGFGFMVGPDTKVQKVEEGVVKKEKEVGEEENGADGTWKVDLSLGLPSSSS